MTMTNVHVTELLHDTTHDDRFGDLLAALRLAMGAGAVDPALIEPLEDPRDVEELIAFSCSTNI